MFQRILLAWDGSEVALRAFDAAIDITRRYDAELVAVSIAYSPAHAETDCRPQRDRRRRPPLPRARPSRRSTIARSAPAWRSPTRSSTATHPAKALLEYAHTHGFDLIVCGHHPTRRAGRLLLHDIAQDLIQTAHPCPRRQQRNLT